MNSNFRWHHVEGPDYELPTLSLDLIVRCTDGYMEHATDEVYPYEKYCVAYYENGKFFHNDTSEILTNVAAWCYLKDVYEQLNNTGWGFDPDREANNADNT
jgi:hypothetical protein